MTYDEIRASDKDVLTPTDVAPVLKCNPYAINVQAKDDPAKLGFRVAVIGTNVKIPRLAFIRFMEGTIQESRMDHGQTAGV